MPSMTPSGEVQPGPSYPADRSPRSAHGVPPCPAPSARPGSGCWPRARACRWGAGPHPDTGPLDTRAWFGRDAPLVLEIGCGSGTSTLAMAQEEPDIDVIAVEVYRRGLAQLLCAIDREQVTNIRLIRGERRRRAGNA